MDHLDRLVTRANDDALISTDRAVSIVASGSSSDDVTLDNPSPVPLGTTAVFTCSATAFSIGWDPANATNTTVMADSQAGNVFRTSKLSILAIVKNNNTVITCVAGNLQRNEILKIYG